MTFDISYFRNFQKIRSLGIEAPVKELGQVGMAYFMRQFEPGDGSYTAERAELPQDVTMDDILRDLEKMRAGGDE
jgi:hypothetical protein